tara:strand:- start:26506 stop:27045 length:540 start_codon:yes stop_codon:yes gene_type:complete
METLKKISRIWIVNAVVVILMMAAFVIFKEVQIDQLLNIQFSIDLNTFKSIITDNSINMRVLRANTYLDFAFIFFYSFLFYFSMRVFDLTLNLKLSKWYYILCFVPGLFDILENICLLILIEDLTMQKAKLFLFYYLFVRLKWSLLIVFVITTMTIVLFYTTHLLKLFINWLMGATNAN